MKKGLSIAIDGPAAAGKGTIAKLLAQKLNGIYLDTGAMYRCVTLFCVSNGIDINNKNDVISSLPNINIEFTNESVLLNGKDVTKEIRASIIDKLITKISHLEKVRENMILRQQKIATEAISSGVAFIAEGRDIATEVLPNADLKIFLTADPKIRAQRRLKQLEERGEKEDLDKIQKEINQRDTEDNHALAKDTEKIGYYILDDSTLSQRETIDIIISLVNKLNDKH